MKINRENTGIIPINRENISWIFTKNDSVRIISSQIEIGNQSKIFLKKYLSLLNTDEIV